MGFEMSCEHIDASENDIRFQNGGNGNAELMRITPEGRVFLHDTQSDTWIEVDAQGLFEILRKFRNN